MKKVKSLCTYPAGHEGPQRSMLTSHSFQMREYMENKQSWYGFMNIKCLESLVLMVRLTISKTHPCPSGVMGKYCLLHMNRWKSPEFVKTIMQCFNSAMKWEK